MTKFALIATSGDATVPTSLTKIAGTNESWFSPGPFLCFREIRWH